MKIIKIVVAVVVVTFVVDSQQAEIYCPRGFIIQGQVNYRYSANEENKNYKHAMCLICRVNSFAVTPFGTVEVCIFRNTEFRNNTYYRRSLQICGYDSQDSKEIKKNFSDICLKSYSSPTCGISIDTTKKLNEAIEKVEFLKCSKANEMPNQPQIVDIQCPETWKLGGTKKQFKTYYFDRHQGVKFTPDYKAQEELCVVCNSTKLLETKYQIFFCTATLDLFLLDSTLKMMIHNETQTQSKEKSNNTSNFNSSIYRLSFSSNKYQFNEQIPYEELIEEKYITEGPKVNCSFSNVSVYLLVVVFAVLFYFCLLFHLDYNLCQCKKNICIFFN
jgi:hypothetical protein